MLAKSFYNMIDNLCCEDFFTTSLSTYLKGSACCEQFLLYGFVWEFHSPVLDVIGVPGTLKLEFLILKIDNVRLVVKTVPYLLDHLIFFCIFITMKSVLIIGKFCENSLHLTFKESSLEKQEFINEEKLCPIWPPRSLAPHLIIFPRSLARMATASLFTAGGLLSRS